MVQLEFIPAVVYLEKRRVRNLKIILGFVLFFTFCLANAQANSKGYFQRNRRAFQKARYAQTSKKYGKACDIFEKRRIKGEKKPIIRLGFRRKSSKKLAEQ